MEAKRVFILVGILAAIASIIITFILFFMYQTKLKEELNHMRVLAQGEARLLEEIFKFDKEHFASHGQSAEEAFSYSLAQIRAAHEKYVGFGKTGEFLLAMRHGEYLHFLLSHRHDKTSSHDKVALIKKDISIPIQRAILGYSETLIAKDYRGVDVIAAAEPLKGLENMGIVAKIDLAEIREPFIKTAIIILVISLLLITIGVWLVFKATNPLIARVRKSEAYYKTLIRVIPEVVVEMDKNKKIKWLNETGSSFFDENTIGKELQTLFLDRENESDLSFEKASKIVYFENTFFRKDGKKRLLAWQCSQIKDEKGQATGILATARDITDSRETYLKLKQTNRLLYLISNCNQILVRSDDEKTLLNEITNLLIKEGDYHAVFIGELTKDKIKTIAFNGDCSGKEAEDYLNSQKENQETIPVFEAIKTLKSMIRHKISMQKNSDKFYTAGLFPFKFGDSLGILILCSQDSKIFDEKETALLEELASDIGFGILTIRTADAKKQREKELSELNIRYQMAQKASNTGTWELDIHNGKIYCDDSLKKLMGYDSNELSNDFKDWFVFFHPDDIEILKNAIIEITECKRRDFAGEYRFLQKDGSYRWFYSSGSCFVNDIKDCKIYGATLDITDRLTAEIELRESEKRYKILFENVQDGIVIIDENQTILFANQIADKLFEKEVLIGEKLAIAFDKNSKNEIEIKTTTPSNINKNLLLRVAESIWENKKVYQITIHDFTELYEKEEQMIAQSRQAAMGDMIAMIAHQWRQPITVIAMAVNNIELSIDLGEELTPNSIRGTLNTITQQTQHLSKTIDDFRNFFKPNKEKELTTIKTTIDKTLEIVGKSLENNNISLKIEDKCDKKITTYPNELLQVFLNIIGNAKDILKNRKTKDSIINISIYEENNFIKTAICDNGGGIKEENLKKIGEPYFTTKKEDGTGLGIYMSKIIIQKHMNGTLEWFNSETGACFVVSLPLDKIEGVLE